MLAKFEVYSFNCCRDMERSHNLKSRSRDPFPTPFDLNYISLVSIPDNPFACQIWSF